MRYSICFILVFLVFVTFAAQSYAIDPDSMLGIWLLDENDGNVVSDSSGNGRDGEIMGIPAWVKGKIGNGLEFPEQGDNQVVIAHDDALSVQTFSITAWVNLVNNGAYQALVEKGEIVGDVRNFYLAVTPEAILYGGFKGNNGWNSITADVVADEEWHHTAVTYDMKEILVYLDGKSYSDLSLGAEGGIEPLQNEAPITFGVTNTSGNEPAQGIIDEVGLFNKGLSEADIKSIMSNGLKQAALSVGHLVKLATTWGNVKSF